MNLDELPKPFQAACAYVARPILARLGIKYEMSDVCKTLQIEHQSMLSSARQFTKFIFSNPAKEDVKKVIELEIKLNEKCFNSDIYEYKSNYPDCWTKDERNQMTDDFKDLLILKKEEYNLSWEDVHRLLGIPLDTLKKLKRQKSTEKDDDDDGSHLFVMPEHIIEKLSKFFKSRESKATVKDFIDKNPEVLQEISLDYRQFSSLLVRLGFVSPRGIFLSNTGLDVIKRFAPNSIWGTDGKNINIIINGELYRWVWQCLIDYKTTVLVGGVINKSETTGNLLEAIVQAKEATGISPMAIVLDNRLSENLPAVKEYLNKLNIEIIKTFPGNSKSNGIIENNFRVFENWVHGKDGNIIINADSPESLSLSIAQLLTEIFTQMRSHAPRASLGGKSSSDVAKNTPPLSQEEMQKIRDEIKALANRFKNESALPIICQAKEQAILLAFELVKPPNQEIFRKRIGAAIFTNELILQAIGIFKTQSQKYPEKKFDHTYFGGILRNLADQQSLEWLQVNLESVYAKYYENLNSALLEINIESQDPLESCKKLIEECLNTKIPAAMTFAFVYLQNILIFIGSKCLIELKTVIEILIKKVLQSKLIQFKKRELVIRKLYNFESFVKTIKLKSENIIEKTAQVFSKSTEPLAAM
jgi:hypothetical protein